jgi:hypothetical protein
MCWNKAVQSNGQDEPGRADHGRDHAVELRAEQSVLRLEVRVEGGPSHLRPARDFAHADRLVSAAVEELDKRRVDPPAGLKGAGVGALRDTLRFVFGIAAAGLCWFFRATNHPSMTLAIRRTLATSMLLFPLLFMLVLVLHFRAFSDFLVFWMHYVPAATAPIA